MGDPFKSLKKTFAEIVAIWGIFDLFNALQTLYDLNLSLSSGKITASEYNNQIVLQFVIYPAILSAILVFATKWLLAKIHK
jgi:hypothetical protein